MIRDYLFYRSSGIISCGDVFVRYGENVSGRVVLASRDWMDTVGVEKSKKCAKPGPLTGIHKNVKNLVLHSLLPGKFGGQAQNVLFATASSLHFLWP
jgi:hypothetical protein